MKKVFAFVLASVMMLTLVACGNTDNQKDDGKKNEHEVNLMDEYGVYSTLIAEFTTEYLKGNTRQPTKEIAAAPLLLLSLPAERK